MVARAAHRAAPEPAQPPVARLRALARKTTAAMARAEQAAAAVDVDLAAGAQVARRAMVLPPGAAVQGLVALHQAVLVGVRVRAADPAAVSAMPLKIEMSSR